jgi:hypothetical protein
MAAVHDGKDKEVALEMGTNRHLGDDGQTMLQACPPTATDKGVALA